MIVALVALFVALGGSAYAANQLAKNSVGTKQLKRNAVTTAKLKKNVVTTPKIKNNAITGAKVNEGTLGAVPSATSATNATNATNAANFSKYFASGLKKASPGQTVPLITIGPFAIVGKCADAGAGNTEATTYMTTSQAGSSMFAYEVSYDEANFNPGTEAELGYEAYDNSPYISWDEQYPYYTGWFAASADGAYLLNGNAVNAVNVFGSPCAFWVEARNAA